MPGRPARGWRRKIPYERLVDLYTDTHTKLETAFRECPSRDARGDSDEVHLFLEKLAEANLRLRLLRALCRHDVKDLVDGATEEVDKAVRAPVTETAYKDPSPWLMSSIQAVDEAARRNVDVIL
jgi:hypothetical protein